MVQVGQPCERRAEDQRRPRQPGQPGCGKRAEVHLRAPPRLVSRKKDSRLGREKGLRNLSRQGRRTANSPGALGALAAPVLDGHQSVRYGASDGCRRRWVRYVLCPRRKSLILTWYPVTVADRITNGIRRTRSIKDYPVS